MLGLGLPMVVLILTTAANHFCCKKSDSDDVCGIVTTDGNTLPQQLPAHFSVVRDIVVAVLKLLQVVTVNLLVTEALKLTGGRCVL